MTFRRLQQPRLLVLTLNSGENEFIESRASLQSQNYHRWEHRVWEGLPNRLAHLTLYNEIMRQRDQFDLFIKLDADMVFSNERALPRIVELFENDSTLDHVIFSVRDWMSDSDILGLHAYSNRAAWNSNTDTLFVDPLPRIPGRRVVLRQPADPIAYHCPNPSPYQAFHFGIHRAAKALQRGRGNIRWGQALQQRRILEKVWDHLQVEPDHRLALALLGAQLVWNETISDPGEEYQNPEVNTLFQPWATLDREALIAAVEPVWKRSTVARIRWLSALARGSITKLAGLTNGTARG